MKKVLDLEAAAAFLARSRSPFLRTAGHWIMHLDDPSDVLILLSGDVGQHLGPWDCFRHCALLGLHHSDAVKSLALDVLSEIPDTDHGPPIAPCFAVAWAVDRFPEEDRPYAQALLEMLDKNSHHPRVPPALLYAAELALCGPAGAAANAQRAQRLDEPIRRSLQGAQGAAVAVPLWEAALLSDSPIRHQASVCAIAGQQPDGGLLALSDNPLLRGFATLRGLALEKRAHALA